MKTALFYVSFVWLIVLSSCQERTVVAPIDSAARVLRKEITALPYAEQQERHATLPPATKASLWADKIDEVQSLDWNFQQKEHLKLVKELFAESTFTGQEMSEGLNAKFKAMYTEGVLLFNSNDYKMIVAELADFQSTNYSSSARLALSDCSCSSGTGYFCRGGCPIGGCQTSYYGCGWGWMSRCNGGCGGQHV